MLGDRRRWSRHSDICAFRAFDIHHIIEWIIGGNSRHRRIHALILQCQMGRDKSALSNGRSKCSIQCEFQCVPSTRNDSWGPLRTGLMRPVRFAPGKDRPAITAAPAGDLFVSRVTRSLQLHASFVSAYVTGGSQKPVVHGGSKSGATRAVKARLREPMKIKGALRD